jgi:hypothetical protein
MIAFWTFLLIVATLVFVGYPLFKSLPESEADIEEEVARLRRKTGRDRKLACLKCGASYGPGDKFCHRCGSKLDIQRSK